MAWLEPPGMGLRRLYDLPVFTTTGTLSLTSTVLIQRHLNQTIHRVRALGQTRSTNI